MNRKMSKEDDKKQSEGHTQGTKHIKLENVYEDFLVLITEQTDHMNQQKEFLAEMSRSLITIGSTLLEYKKHVEKLDTHLENNIKLQVSWHSTYEKMMPGYQDYSLIPRQTPDNVTVSELEDIADATRVCMWTGQFQTKKQESVARQVKSKMDSRKKLIEDNYPPIYDQLASLYSEQDNLEQLKSQLLEDVSTTMSQFEQEKSNKQNPSSK